MRRSNEENHFRKLSLFPATRCSDVEKCIATHECEVVVALNISMR
jgi:hypothetical protein